MRAVKVIISGVLAFGVCLTPLTIPLMVRPSWGQSQTSRLVEALGLQKLPTEEELQLCENELQGIQEKLQSSIQTAQQSINNRSYQIIEKLNKYIVICRKLKQEVQVLKQVIELVLLGKNQQAVETIQQVTKLSEELKLLVEEVKNNELNETREINRKLEQVVAKSQILILVFLGGNYIEIGQAQRSLEYFDKALYFSRQINDSASDSLILSLMGETYYGIGRFREALQYYEQSLIISKKIGNRTQEAWTLANIGLLHSTDGRDRDAMLYYEQSLIISRNIGNHVSEAWTLNKIGEIYRRNQQFQKALSSFEQALSVFKQIGFPVIQINILKNLGFVYQGTNRPNEAINYYEKALELSLQMRSGLLRVDRQVFLQSLSRKESTIALISLLIDQNQPEKAFEWANLATTADLADYTRLINAKVSNPQAQQLIDQWNQKNQQIQFLYSQFQSNPSDQLSRQINAFQEENNKLAEEISRQFPEAAELFETKPTDIEKLRAFIPEGTVVIQPVLLTNVKNVPDTVAIFILTKDQLSVIKKAIDPTELGKLLTQYREQLQNYNDPNYTETSAKLYNILIRPVEDKIKAFSPKQLSIIATGELRYIPFETLYDEQTDQLLIQKYPINYLTRLSSRSLSNVNETFLQRSILALGNPITEPPYYNMPDAPEEVESITQLLPSSQVYIGKTATLETFKTQAPRFSILHLATHGCFQPEGCCLPKSPDCRKPDKVDLKPNTILFADQQLNIADAALLGLQNTELLTLSACQTAMQANSNGEEIAGVAYIFERAGAKAVMASLWNAEDKATKDIMIQFYQNIKNGMSKGEALRKAKLSQIERHPYYWSPFILIGDAR